MGIAGISPEIDWCYHEDLQGTILATSGAPDGFYNANFHTDSWGNLLTGWAANNPYLYLGGLGYWEENIDLDLKYVRARWLDPTIGQWLSVDPVASEPRYAYAHNSPTMRVDASGRQAGPPFVSSFDPISDIIHKKAGDDLLRMPQHGPTAHIGAGSADIWGPVSSSMSGRNLGELAIEQMPPLVGNLLPVPYMARMGGWYVGLPTLEWVEWDGGFMVGYAEGVLWSTRLGFKLFLGTSIITTIKAIFTTRNWGNVGIVFQNMWSSLSSLFTTRQTNFSPYEKGVVFGNLLVMVISLLHSIISAGKMVAALAPRVAALLKSSLPQIKSAMAQVAGGGADLPSTGFGSDHPGAGGGGGQGHPASTPEPPPGASAVDPDKIGKAVEDRINDLVHESRGGEAQGVPATPVLRVGAPSAYLVRPLTKALSEYLPKETSVIKSARPKGVQLLKYGQGLSDLAKRFKLVVARGGTAAKPSQAWNGNTSVFVIDRGGGKIEAVYVVSDTRQIPNPVPGGQPFLRAHSEVIFYHEVMPELHIRPEQVVAYYGEYTACAFNSCDDILASFPNAQGSLYASYRFTVPPDPRTPPTDKALYDHSLELKYGGQQPGGTK